MSLLKSNISRPGYQIISIGFVEISTISYIKWYKCVYDGSNESSSYTVSILPSVALAGKFNAYVWKIMYIIFKVKLKISPLSDTSVILQYETWGIKWFCGKE